MKMRSSTLFGLLGCMGGLPGVLSKTVTGSVVLVETEGLKANDGYEEISVHYQGNFGDKNHLQALCAQFQTAIQKNCATSQPVSCHTDTIVGAFSAFIRVSANYNGGSNCAETSFVAAASAVYGANNLAITPDNIPDQGFLEIDWDSISSSKRDIERHHPRELAVVEVRDGTMRRGNPAAIGQTIAVASGQLLKLAKLKFSGTRPSFWPVNAGVLGNSINVMANQIGKQYALFATTRANMSPDASTDGQPGEWRATYTNHNGADLDVEPGDWQVLLDTLGRAVLSSGQAATTAVFEFVDDAGNVVFTGLLRLGIGAGR